MTAKTWAKVLPSLFVAEAVYAVIHRATGGEYGTFTHAHNAVIDVALATIWSAAALAVALRTFTLPLGIIGTTASVIHGTLFCLASSSPDGLPFLAAGPLILVALIRSAPVWMSDEEEKAVHPMLAPLYKSTSNVGRS